MAVALWDKKGAEALAVIGAECVRELGSLGSMWAQIPSSWTFMGFFEPFFVRFTLQTASRKKCRSLLGKRSLKTIIKHSCFAITIQKLSFSASMGCSPVGEEWICHFCYSLLLISWINLFWGLSGAKAKMQSGFCLRNKWSVWLSIFVSIDVLVFSILFRALIYALSNMIACI